MKTRILSLALLLAAFLFTQARAQEADLKPLTPNVPAKTSSSAEIPVIHITDDLTNSPEGQAALKRYIDAREAGTLSAGKGGPTEFDIGDEKSFNVMTNVQTQNSNWVTRTFILRSTNAVANVWIDKTLNSDFSEANLAELDEHMLHSTPGDSYRPDRGIIENDNDLFGAPPNYDGDGKVDILLHDITEGSGESCCVLGYVTAVDIDPGASGNNGNQADILYVDLPDGMKSGSVSRIAWIVAHEYSHLIHYAYQTPPGSELTFVNEGLAEYGSVANGYFHRNISYLTKPTEHGTRLFDWDTSDNLNDYERAGLFTTYIGDRIGATATGSIVRAEKDGEFGVKYANGAEGYDIVLNEHGTNLSSIIADFHTANFVNDRNTAPEFGYINRHRSGLKAVPTVAIDGASKTSSELTDLSINSGSVRYITWTDVANVSVQGDIYSEIAPVLVPSLRKKIILRVIVEHVGGSTTVETMTPGEETVRFDGEFRRFTVAIVNTATGSDAPIRFDLRTSWGEGESNAERQAVAYENGTAAGPNFYYALGGEAVLASKFAVPEKGRLASVFVAPVYDNDFSNSELPDTAPRDFQVRVYDVDTDGFPGALIFQRDVSESPSTTHINFGTKAFTFLEIPVGEESALASLGDSVFVAMANSGSDANYLALTPAVLQEEGDVSYLYLDFQSGAGWASFAGITVDDEPIFEDKVHPIRVEFLVSTSTDSEGADELPAQVSLSQNYPNPFNPSTSISYSLPQTMQVRLAVYDALGRLVTTVVDGVQTSGTHEVQLEAANWASGVYFYTLETEAQTVSKHMVLMK